MEEKTGKGVKVSEAGVSAPQADGQGGDAPQKAKGYTYEQVSHIAAELSSQNRELRKRLSEAERYIEASQTGNLFQYLAALQKVIDGPVMYSDGFVTACVGRVERIIGALDVLLPPAASAGAASDGVGVEDGGDGEAE